MNVHSIPVCFDCPKCGKQTCGFARCKTAGCGWLRQEFQGLERLVVEEIGYCVQSDSRTDVRLPNGDYLWPPYFFDFLQGGWLDEHFAYTELFYEKHPNLRELHKARHGNVA
jgi:hypothetical protein